jgi:hypothetical protein
MKYLILIVLCSYSMSSFSQEEVTPFNKFSRKAKEVGNKTLDELKKAKEKVVGEDKKEVVEDTPKIEESENKPTFIEEAKTKTVEISKKTTDEIAKVNAKMNETQFHRSMAMGTAMFHYQPISTWMPSKKALSYTHIFSREWSAEFEYAWASISFPVFGIDIGEISEKRYSLQARKYVGNSFHFIFGGYKNEFRARIGNDILDRMTDKSIDVFSVQNMGATLGIGNRWQLKNGFTWGVDWFRINIPLFGKKTDDKILTNTSDEGDRDDIKKITRRFESFPTFVLLGLNIGYTF